jgi:predicted nucleic acid-binding protein
VRPTILDTCIFIDDLRTGKHEARVNGLRGPIRTSAVVLAELHRSVRKPRERAFLKDLAGNHPVLTPTESNWIESGEILVSIRAEHHLARESLAHLHFDVLIALTARSAGARLITSNRADFEMIRLYRDFELEIW